MLNVCTTVFNRYDLLARQFDSIRVNRVPVKVHVIDRGGRAGHVADLARGLYVDIIPNVGGNSLAAAWNWFLTNVPDDRLIVAEDVHFGPGAFAHILAKPQQDCMVTADGRSAKFCAFVLRDRVVQDVGLFDETISPDYLYFEDWDYQKRMALKGITPYPLIDIYHDHRADGHGTLGAKTPAQIADHHKRFKIALNNYVKKWGTMPPIDTSFNPYAEAPMSTPDERYEQLNPRIVARDQRDLIEKLQTALRAHRAAAINFVAKVEDGKARSVVSYAEFKAALKVSEDLL